MPLPVPKPLAATLRRFHIAQAGKIFIDAVDIVQRQMAELRLQLDDPEVLIRPNIADVNLFDRVDVHELAGRGEQATLAALPGLRRAITWQSRALRSVRRVVQFGS